VPNDLRHESESSDLQSTCRALEAQKLENDKLRAEYDDLKSKMESCEALRELTAQSHGFDARQMRCQIENLKTELESMQKRFTRSQMIDEITQSEGSGDCGIMQKLEDLTADYVSDRVDVQLNYADANGNFSRQQKVLKQNEKLEKDLKESTKVSSHPKSHIPMPKNFKSK
jgi:hypothetical protein